MSGFPPPLPAPPAHRQLPQTWVRVPFAFVVSPASLRAWQRAERSAHSTNVRSMQQKSPEGEDTGLLLLPQELELKTAFRSPINLENRLS